MFRKHVSLLVALSLILLVATACIVRTNPNHRHRHRGGPEYRERKDHRKDHRKNQRKNGKNRGRWSRFDEAPTPMQQMTEPRSNGLADQ